MMIPWSMLEEIEYLQNDNIENGGTSQVFLIARRSAVKTNQGSTKPAPSSPVYEAVNGRMFLTSDAAEGESMQSDQEASLTKWTVVFSKAVTLKATDEIIVNAIVTLNDAGLYASHTGGKVLRVDGLTDLNQKHTITEVVCIYQQ